jgi:hypothetical protein
MGIFETFCWANTFWNIQSQWLRAIQNDADSVPVSLLLGNRTITSSPMQPINCYVPVNIHGPSGSSDIRIQKIRLRNSKNVIYFRMRLRGLWHLKWHCRHKANLAQHHALIKLTTVLKLILRSHLIRSHEHHFQSDRREFKITKARSPPVMYQVSWNIQRREEYRKRGGQKVQAGA